MFTPWTQAERANLLLSRAVSQSQYEMAMEAGAGSQPWSQSESDALAAAEEYMAAIEAAEREYFQRLPREVLSCCPICHRPLVRTFDSFGLDGPWWRSDAQPEEAPSCPHFCVLLGAIGFGDRPPRAGSFEVSPGPEAPYVVPRLLSYPSMRAVVSSIPMQPGFHGFSIAYFAESCPRSQDLMAGWARRIHTYIDLNGRPRWQIDNSEWDFELRRWLENGRLFWCPPRTGNFSVSTEAPETCPFVDLPGRRTRLVVCGDRIVERGAPDGSSVHC